MSARVPVLQVAIVSATATFACIKIDPFKYADGGMTASDAPPDLGVAGAPEVNFVADGNSGASVVGSGFNVHFGSGNVFHYPDRMNVNNAEIIGRAPAVACNNEDEVGVALYPSARIAVHGAAAITSSTLLPILTGPAVVKVEVASTTLLSGSNDAGEPGDRSPTIRSRFTFHPDGKVFRYDTIENGSGDELTNESINCQSGPTGFIPTSFTTLRLDPGASLYQGSNNVMVNLPQIGEAAIEGVTQSSACLDYGGVRQVAFAWPTAITRIRAPTESTIAFVYDLDRDAGGSSTVPSASYELRSAMFFGRNDSCTAAGGVHDLARRWRDTHELTINGVPRGIANDGIYGGESDPGNTVGIDMPMSGLTITGDVPMSFAVWVLYDPGTNGLTIEKAPAATPPFYQLQRVDSFGREWVVWFRDPLSAGQTLTIRPQ